MSGVVDPVWYQGRYKTLNRFISTARRQRKSCEMCMEAAASFEKFPYGWSAGADLRLEKEARCALPVYEHLR